MVRKGDMVAVWGLYGGLRLNNHFSIYILRAVAVAASFHFRYKVDLGHVSK